MKYKANIFFTNVSVLFVGTLVSQLINLGGLPILSRLYGTEAFALLALFLAINSITLSFSTLQLDLAIVKNEEFQERAGLIKLSFLTSFFISLVVSLLCLSFGKFLNSQINKEFSLLIFVYMLVTAGNQILTHFFNSERKYKNIATARILLALVNILLAMFLFNWDSKIGLLAAITLANTISFLFLLFLFRKRIYQTLSIPFLRLGNIYRNNIKFVQFSTPASFLDILSYQFIILFLSRFFSDYITGSFFMALRIVILPTALIGGAISQVFYKEIAEKYAQQILKTKDFWKIWQLLTILGLLPFSILFFFGKEIFGFVLGGEWILAGEMASILAIKGFFTFLSSPTSSGFVVMNYQQFNLWNSSIRLTYTIVFLMISYYQQNFFIFLWGYSITEFLVILIYNFWMVKLLKNSTNRD